MPDAVQLLLKGGCVLRLVRIFYEKKGRLKFVSHLDMNRFMIRAVRLSGVPLWYTEGFNPHPYLTFALPLSLGFESEYEAMDLRIMDDDFSNEQVADALSKVMPADLQIIRAADPVMKPGKITLAEFMIEFETNRFVDFAGRLNELLCKESIKVIKTGKKGKKTEIDLAPKLDDVSVIYDEAMVTLTLTLPAGSVENINPALFITALEEDGAVPPYRITRKALMTEEKTLFK